MMTTAAFTAIKHFLRDWIDHAEYVAGGVTYRADSIKEIKLNGHEVTIEFVMSGANLGSSGASVARLVDRNGDVFATTSTFVERSSDESGIWIQFGFVLNERAITA